MVCVCVCVVTKCDIRYNLKLLRGLEFGRVRFKVFSMEFDRNFKIPETVHLPHISQLNLAAFAHLMHVSLAM